LEQLDLLSDDEENDLSGVRKNRKKIRSSLDTVDQIKEMVKYMMMNCLDATKILKAIEKLHKTDSGLLRKFVHFRGISILQQCLLNHLDAKDFVRFNFLNVLTILPVSTKNAVEKIEEVVKLLCDEVKYGADTARIANKVNWK
jgi:hypothetical protein